MDTASMRLYDLLSSLPFPTSYAGKLFLIAFVGTHVPLLGAILYTVISELSLARAAPILATTLVATVAGVAITFWGIYRLLAPIRATTDALNAYVEDKTPPELPTTYEDRVGILMSRTQQTILHLDELLQFRTRMLGVVSHDARGPATSILMATDQISRQVNSANPDLSLLRSLTDSVEQAVEYQLDMTHALLDVARYGEGQLRLNVTEASVQELLDGTKRLLQAHAERRNHDFDVTLDDGHGDTIETDAEKLEQVISNLVSNAIKYTPKGGRVHLHADVSEDDVTFRVSDDGNGIPESIQDSLFEAYSTEDTTGTNDGIGLGLWISRTFTDALGGTIDVESSPGEGTTFTVRIPRRVEAHTGEQRP